MDTVKGSVLLKNLKKRNEQQERRIEKLILTSQSGAISLKKKYETDISSIGDQIHNLGQRSVRPVPQFVTFDIVSRYFENKNNDCCETKIYKNTICLLLFITNLQIHFCGLDVLTAG